MDILQNEEWKDVVGFEGKYSVSNYGRVRSLLYNNTKETKLLSTKTNHGYKEVTLSKNGKWKTYRVHRLVATAFISNPNNLPCINHKDEDKLNNFVYINEDGSVNLEKSNLEWCTYGYNNAYGSARKKVSSSMTNHPRLSKRILQLSKTNKIIKEWISIAEIHRSLGLRQCNIISCCKGRRNTCGGFIWKYKNV